MPAGAIPKDGPSAGVTMATAICSLVTGTPVSSEVAMTGEVTLTGQVLPIGGLKEKTLAAQRAGIHTVIIPTRNQADLEDVPENLRADMRFVPVDRVEQVWEAAMGLTLGGRAGREIVEAHELLEEAQELLGKARKAAGDGGRTGGGKAPAGAPPATRAGKRGRKPAAKPVVRQKGQAKKSTAARGRSGRKK